MDVGKVVIQSRAYTFDHKNDEYTHVICVSVDPLVLMSEDGEAIWKSTDELDELIPLCYASQEITDFVRNKYTDHLAVLSTDVGVRSTIIEALNDEAYMDRDEFIEILSQFPESLYLGQLLCKAVKLDPDTSHNTGSLVKIVNSVKISKQTKVANL